MQAAPVSLLLPCEVITVRVLACPDEQGRISTLQQLALRAIGSGSLRITLDDLVVMFGLGHRPTLDLVQDFWNRGYVSVDPVSGVLSLTTPTQRRIEDGTLDVLDSGRVREGTSHVLRELVTGHVIARHRASALAFGGMHVPPVVEPSAGHLTNDEHAELLELLGQSVARSFAGQSMQLLEAIPVTTGPAAIPTRTVIRLRAHVEQIEPGEYRFDLRHPSRIPARMRADIAQRLGRLAREDPSQSFVVRLARRLTPTEAETRDPLGDALTRLAQACAALEVCLPEEFAAYHAASARVADEVSSLLRAREERTAKVSVIAGQAAFHEQVRRAIQEAREQIVLACPFTHADGFARFREDLAEAVRERGIRVIVLWGMGPDDEIDAQFAGGLAQLVAPGALGAVVRSTESARVHAKLVIRDGTQALVGSANFLSSAGGGAELGVLVGGTDVSASQVVTDLLRWARALAPDAHVREAMQVWSPVPNASLVLPGVPEAPPPVRAGGQIPREMALAHAVCRAEWSRFRDAISAMATHPRPAVQTLTNEEHRDLFRHALRAARWRLLVASDRLNDEAFDARMQRLLRERLTEGLRVALIWRRAGSAGPDGIEMRLRALQAEFPDHLTLIHDANHAKVLVWDDDAVVASFNFLSFEGVYSVTGGRRMRAELGLHVSAGSVADAVVQAMASQLQTGSLGAWFAGGTRPASVAALPIIPVSVDDIRTAADASKLLRRLLSAGDDPRRRRKVVHEAFAEPSDASDKLPKRGMTRPDPAERSSEATRGANPASLLALIEAAGGLAPNEQWEATLLTLRSEESRTHPRYVSWLRSVAVRLWEQRHFFDVSALLAWCPQPPGDLTDAPSIRSPSDSAPPDAAPTSRIALLAAVAHAREPFVRRLLEIAASEHWTVDEFECACAVGVQVLLREGWDEVAEVLEQMTSNADGPAGRLARAYLDTWWANSLGGPFPRAALVRLVEAETARQRQATALDRVTATFNRGAAHTDATFRPGEKTVHAMFGRVGSLRPLRDAVYAGDVARVRIMLAELGDPEDVVERAWHDVRDRPVQLAGNRRPQIDRLAKEAIGAVGSWLETVPMTGQEFRDDELQALAQLRAAFEHLLPALADAAESSASGVLLSMCVEELEPLRRWRPTTSENA